MKTLIALTIVGALALTAAATSTLQDKDKKPMELGNFSVSLTVKDIKVSKEFYEKLDFKQVAGNVDQKWVIVQNGTTTIGLFQGMFPRNTMTFNPGWTHKMETLKDFQDVREMQRALEKRGIQMTTKADEKTTGPASFTIADPDGNPILFDQHVDSPKR